MKVSSFDIVHVGKYSLVCVDCVGHTYYWYADKLEFLRTVYFIARDSLLFSLISMLWNSLAYKTRLMRIHPNE